MIRCSVNWVTMKGKHNISSRWQPRLWDYFKISTQQKEGQPHIQVVHVQYLLWFHDIYILEFHQWQMTGLTLSSVDDMRVNPSLNLTSLNTKFKFKLIRLIYKLWSQFRVFKKNRNIGGRTSSIFSKGWNIT